MQPEPMPSKTDRFNGFDLARRFFAGTAASYDLTVDLWTLGLDRRWKAKIIGMIPPAPKRMIDQACGTGILTLQMARRYPGCRIFGVDIHREYLALAARKSKSRGLANIDFVLGRAEDVVFKGNIDCITSSYLAKYAEMEKLIAGAARMLRKGGVLVMHDFTYPPNRALGRVLRAYFRIMQTVGSRFFPEWKTVFHELEDLLKASRWVTELIAALERNCFVVTGAERLTLGFAAVVCAVKI